MKNLWFIVLVFLGFINGMYAAPVSQKAKKTEINLEIKSLGDAEKLYDFLGTNSGEIVSLNITYNPKSDRKLYVNKHNVDNSGCEATTTQIDTGKQSEQRLSEYCSDDSGIVYHIGTNQIGKDRSKMNETWKQQNDDVVLAAYLDMEIVPDQDLADIKDAHISFENYGGGTGFFHTIYIQGVKRDIFNENKISGLFYVNSECAFPNVEFLETSGGLMEGDTGVDNGDCLSIEMIDPKTIKTIKYFIK